MRGLSFLAFLLLPADFGCAKHESVVKDQLVVEQYRNRITKVRNAIDETRAVIARSQGAPYEAELNMRLAELISEEAKYHYMVAYEREGGKDGDGSQLHVPQVRELKLQAIDIYENILKNYPDTHLADRVLFNISHEHRELGDFDKMLEALQRLVDNYPDSPYRSEALLVLGDYYFDKVELPTAEKYYEGIIKARDPLLLGLAQYKEAWVKVNFGDCNSALTHFESAINAARSVKAKEDKQQALVERQPRVDPPFEIPDADPRFAFAGHKSIDVEREALVDLTYCYAQERPPEKAVEYLEAHASTREAYVAALHKMALRFATLEQPKGAADVTRELLRLGSDDDERLDDARLLHSVVTRMNDYSQVGEDVDLILKAMRRRLLRPDLDEAGQKQLVREFEMITRDLATRSQKVLDDNLAEKTDPAAAPVAPKTGKPDKNRSLASKGKEWNQIPATPQESAKAYEAYLRAIPDSPYRLEMVTNLADVLIDAGDFLEAGNRYREAAAILAKKTADGQSAAVKEDEAKLQSPDAPPDEKKSSTDPDADQSTDKPGKAAADKKDENEAPELSKLSKTERAQRRADALYDAVVAYQKALGSKQSDSHEVRATARAGLRQAGAQYLAEGNPDKARELKIKFAIAETYYNEGKYMQAVDLLTAVALEFPNTEQGDAAVQLVLDSYNTLNDISGLIAAGQLFANAPQLSESVKASVQPILAAAEQRRLDDLSLAAAGDQAGGMESLMAFADVYKGTDLGEKALLNTFVAARAAGDTQKIYTVGDQILKDFPESKEVGGVAATLGQTAAARYEFDRALKYLQMAAEMSREQAPSLYVKAGEIQEQLADKQGALKSYREALRLAPEGSRRSTAAVHA
jgi:tetratricopeptide (TPR) repeat protein